MKLRKLLFTCALVLTALLCLHTLPQQAQAATESDLTFTLNNDGNSYTVSNCKTSAQGTLQIPATYQGKPVTAIGDYAFDDCRYLTSVTIPDSVISVGVCAFSDCNSLNTMTIPDGVTSVSSGVFWGCSRLTSVTLPNSVTSIDDYAFYQCSSLSSITIPEGTISIGEEAFYNCSSLQEITIPMSVTSIGDYSLSYCSSLTGIWVDENNLNYSSDDLGVLFTKDQTALIQVPGALVGEYSIPDGVIWIGKYAFQSCDSLIAVTIPEGAVSIDRGAFWDCNKLNTVTIPDSVINIDRDAFWYCSSLTDVYYGGSEAQWELITVGLNNQWLTNAAIHFNASIFNDVNKTSWQYVHVKYALDRNLMAGKGTDAHGRIKFDPNSPITREEFVQVLYNAEGKPIVDLFNPFPDVLDTGWYKNAVLWAKKNDIANGGGDGNFGVGAHITRQDLALMLYKYAALKGCSLQAESGKINGFADGDKVATYAKTAMDWAVTNGILSGKGTAGQPLSTFRLDPAGTATRAECAAMLKNFMTAFGL